MGAAHPAGRRRLAAPLVTAALVVAGALLAQGGADAPDFAQDYAAAWAVRRGGAAAEPTDELLAACCPAVRAEAFRGTRQPHPPLATAAALPFAAVPFAAARVAWCVLSGLALAAAWSLARTSAMSCVASAPLWVVALVLGTHEPWIALLVAAACAALEGSPPRPRLAGTLLGAASATKVYPLVLVLGLAVSGRARAVGLAIAVAGAATLASELLLGAGATSAWLGDAARNATRYVDVPHNLSFVRALRVPWPELPPGAGTALLAVVLAAPIARRRRDGDLVRALVPAMLLASPLTWRHSVALLSLVPLVPLERAGLGAAGAVTLAFGVGWIPPPPLALVHGALLAVLAGAYVRGLRTRPAAAAP